MTSWRYGMTKLGLVGVLGCGGTRQQDSPPPHQVPLKSSDSSFCAISSLTANFILMLFMMFFSLSYKSVLHLAETGG